MPARKSQRRQPQQQQQQQQQQQEPLRTVKIVVVGDGGAGKTCLLSTFARGHFPRDYTPTVFDNMDCGAVVAGRRLRLSLWDTAGQEDYDQLRPLSYSGADAFLVCYSVAARASFGNACSKWCHEVRRHAPAAAVVLVGNKADLRHDPKCLRHLRRHGLAPVAEAEAREAAAAAGAAAFAETSALRGVGLSHAFEAAVRAALWPETLPPMRKRSRRQCCLQ